MKTKISINSIWGSVLFEFEKEDNTVKDTLVEAISKRANLWEANLWGANLWGANLRGANLRGADLWGANLRGADLWGANLRGANLREADLRGANLREADLREADLWGANLREADLREADLWGANLREADLREADLREADLREADLREADLRGAKNLNPLTGTVLSLLKQQKNKLRAFKYVTEEFKSPQQGDLDYSKGKTVQLTKKECDFSELIECSKGLHVATLEWCLLERSSDQPVIEVEFDPRDIVSIPYATDGKFRVRKLRVIRVVLEKELTKFKNRKVV